MGTSAHGYWYVCAIEDLMDDFEVKSMLAPHKAKRS
jgi:hypothetical protein